MTRLCWTSLALFVLELSIVIGLQNCKASRMQNCLTRNSADCASDDLCTVNRYCGRANKSFVVLQMFSEFDSSSCIPTICVSEMKQYPMNYCVGTEPRKRVENPVNQLNATIAPSTPLSVSPSISISSTISPTNSQTVPSSMSPSTSPSISPSISISPTISPTIPPSIAPSISPTTAPSKHPTDDITMEPTSSPSFTPTTVYPSSLPTFSPTTTTPRTKQPTHEQTRTPTTTSPTTKYPSSVSTLSPTTQQPTDSPATEYPTSTRFPTSDIPTMNPSTLSPSSLSPSSSSNVSTFAPSAVSSLRGFSEYCGTKLIPLSKHEGSFWASISVFALLITGGIALTVKDAIVEEDWMIMGPYSGTVIALVAVLCQTIVLYQPTNTSCGLSQGFFLVGVVLSSTSTIAYILVIFYWGPYRKWIIGSLATYVVVCIVLIGLASAATSPYACGNYVCNATRSGPLISLCALICIVEVFKCVILAMNHVFAWKPWVFGSLIATIVIFYTLIGTADIHSISASSLTRVYLFLGFILAGSLFWIQNLRDIHILNSTLKNEPRSFDAGFYYPEPKPEEIFVETADHSVVNSPDLNVDLNDEGILIAHEPNGWYVYVDRRTGNTFWVNGVTQQRFNNCPYNSHVVF